MTLAKACQSWLSRSRVRRHFAGNISPRAERALRRHLADCADCRQYYDRHLQLAAVDPQALTATERLGRGLGLREPQRSLVGVPLIATLAVACALALWLRLPRSEREVAAEFAARGPSSSPSANGSLTPGGTVRVYHHSSGRSEPVLGGFARSEELSFAYTNPAGFRYLMVAGISESGDVFWYYPAWQDAATTPSAVAIEPSNKLTELPDAVRHQLPGNHLRLLSIFTNQPLTVRQVEDRLSSLGASHGGPLFPGTLEQELPLEVR